MYTDSIRGHLGALSADCLDQLKQLPFADVSNFDTSGSSVDINKERDTQLDIWSSFDAVASNIDIIPR